MTYRGKTRWKVVTEDMKSLGLRKNPSIMEFAVGEWVDEPAPLEGNDDFGGIWVAATPSAARNLRTYMMKKHGKTVRIFECEINRVLWGNDYRIKTDKVKLIKEVFNN